MIIIFVDSHQVQVYWGDLSHREMIEIWFCHSLVRHSYYIWDASMTRTNIGSLIEKWFSDTLFATLMSSMLHVCIVAHQSPIIPCLFFTIIIVSLIDGPYIYVCQLARTMYSVPVCEASQENLLSQGMTEKEGCLIEIKTEGDYRLWGIHTKDTKLEKKRRTRVGRTRSQQSWYKYCVTGLIYTFCLQILMI